MIYTQKKNRPFRPSLRVDTAESVTLEMQRTKYF